MKKLGTIQDVIFLKQTSTLQMSTTIKIYFTYSRVVKSSTFEKKENVLFQKNTIYLKHWYLLVHYKK